ncbi:MAG: diphthine--ammonia ligase [Candidatus Micrarchaeota archaeon]
MRCSALVSGGKDGWFAVWYAISSGLSVEGILTFTPEKKDSFMFHGINTELVRRQAKLSGIPCSLVASSGNKEDDECTLVSEFIRLKHDGFEGVVTGAIESEYQREQIEIACIESELVHFAPLWHRDNGLLLDEMMDSGLDAIIVSVAADGMGKEWLGKRLSECKESLLKLSAERMISPIGEGGEFETFVVDSPLFENGILIKETDVVWSGSSGLLNIKEVGHART